jgi:hypothetical protein
LNDLTQHIAATKGIEPRISRMALIEMNRKTTSIEIGRVKENGGFATNKHVFCCKDNRDFAMK